MTPPLVHQRFLRMERDLVTTAQVLTLADAEALAVLVTSTIDYRHRDAPCGPKCASDMADRERVVADLEGLRHHSGTGDRSDCNACWTEPAYCPDRNRYAAGLIRTAKLYGAAQDGGQADG